MSPRPRLDDARTNQYRLRLSDAELKKLDFCCEKLDMPKSEIIRAGIDVMYKEALKK